MTTVRGAGFADRQWFVMSMVIEETTEAGGGSGVVCTGFETIVVDLHGTGLAKRMLRGEGWKRKWQSGWSERARKRVEWFVKWHNGVGRVCEKRER